MLNFVHRRILALRPSLCPLAFSIVAARYLVYFLLVVAISILMLLFLNLACLIFSHSLLCLLSVAANDAAFQVRFLAFCCLLYSLSTCCCCCFCRFPFLVASIICQISFLLYLFSVPTSSIAFFCLLLFASPFRCRLLLPFCLLISLVAAGLIFAASVDFQSFPLSNLFLCTDINCCNYILACRNFSCSCCSLYFLLLFAAFACLLLLPFVAIFCSFS